jgi:hypothetical protein
MDAGTEIATVFVEAARTYPGDPAPAGHEHAQRVRERGSTIMVPGSAIDSMNLCSIAGFIPLVQARDVAVPEADSETSPEPWPPAAVSMP